MLELTKGIKNKLNINNQNNLKIYTTTEYDYEIIRRENCKINLKDEDQFEILDNTTQDLSIIEDTKEINDINDNNSSDIDDIDSYIIYPFNIVCSIISCPLCFPLNLFVIPHYEKYGNL